MSVAKKRRKHRMARRKSERAAAWDKLKRLVDRTWRSIEMGLTEWQCVRSGRFAKGGHIPEGDGPELIALPDAEMVFNPATQRRDIYINTETPQTGQCFDLNISDWAGAERLLEELRGMEPTEETGVCEAEGDGPELIDLPDAVWIDPDTLQTDGTVTFIDGGPLRIVSTLAEAERLLEELRGMEPTGEDV